MNIIKKMIEKKMDNKINNILYNNNYNISIDEFMNKDKPKDDNVRIIFIDGGIGDHLCATQMINSFRNNFKDKKIIVVSFYPEIYENNPDIDYIYSIRNPDDLYEKWIKKIKYNNSIIKRNIYDYGIHGLFPGKLSEIYCYVYGTPYNGDNIKFYLTDDENNKANKFLSSFKKKVILIHPYGGRINYENKILTENKNWINEYWEELIELLNDEYSTVQIGGNFEEEIRGITTYLMGVTTIRETIALIKNSYTFVSIDSFVAHAGASVNKRGIVLFGRSNPYIYGHDTNINIWANNSCDDLFCGRPNIFCDTMSVDGKIQSWSCPDRKCMKYIKPYMVYEKIKLLKK